jgi:hypothetical protein
MELQYFSRFSKSCNLSVSFYCVLSTTKPQFFFSLMKARKSLETNFLCFKCFFIQIFIITVRFYFILPEGKQHWISILDFSNELLFLFIRKAFIKLIHKVISAHYLKIFATTLFPIFDCFKKFIPYEFFYIPVIILVLSSFDIK